MEDFRVTCREISLYNPVLGQRPRIICANKMDLPDAGPNLDRLRDAFGEEYEIFPVSAATGEGLDALVYRIIDLLDSLPRDLTAIEETEHVVHTPEPRFTVTRQGGIFLVKGKEIERLVAMTDMEQDEAVERLQRIIQRSGIEDALKEAGIKEGDTVKIGKLEFEYVE